LNSALSDDYREARTFRLMRYQHLKSAMGWCRNQKCRVMAINLTFEIYGNVVPITTVSAIGIPTRLDPAATPARLPEIQPARRKRKHS
jgi:hypothetical protein